MKILFVLGSISPTSIPAEWAEGLESRGHSVHLVPVSGGGTPGWTFLSRLLASVGSFKPDIMHFHHTVPALTSLLFIGARRRYRKVLTVHRLMTDMGLKTRVAHTIGGWLGADITVANSQETLASFRPYFGPALGRSRVIYNGIDLDHLDSVQPASSRPIPPVRFISVGRLIPEKRFDTLLLAVAQLRGCDVDPFELVIVGDGPERGSLEALVVSLGISDIVTFLGEMARGEVYRELKAADLFVICSRTEGFCNAVVEAMAAGLPVVVTPGGALTEVVGSAGWIAAEHSVDAVGQAMLAALCTPPEEKAEIAETGILRARQKFSMVRTLDQYESLYAELLDFRNSEARSPSGTVVE